MVEVTENLNIPFQELSFTFSRSSGPGGQHVNKVSTRVTLIFDVVNSPSLSHDQKTRLLQNLATRINKQGLLRLTSYRHRSQKANRTAVIERFTTMLQEALHVAEPRKKTRTPRAAKERRLTDKKHRSRIKRARRSRDTDQD